MAKKKVVRAGLSLPDQAIVCGGDSPITVRDLVAIAALPGVIASAGDRRSRKQVAREAIRMADVLLKELQRDHPTVEEILAAVNANDQSTNRPRESR